VSAEVDPIRIHPASIGDASDTGNLFRRNYAFVHSIALGFVRDHADAQDIVQSVFCKLLISDLLDRTRARQWLAIAAKNAAIDLLRSRRRERLFVDSYRENTTHAVSAESETLLKMELQKLAGHLEELSMETRELLNASFFERRTHVSIANQRQIALGTVKSRIRSGLRQLRLALGSASPVKPL
jgi:RNA polymerase sigma-70 factor (ECF subfamily)